MRQKILHPLVLFFLSALVIRLIAYFVFNYLLFGGDFIHPDSMLYHQTAEKLSSSWITGDLGLVRYPAYVNPIAALYTVFGPNRIFPEMVNILFGSILPVLVYFLGRKLFQEKVGYVAAGIVLLDPLLIYESTQLLRDILLTVFTVGAVLGAVYWKDRPWLSWFGGMASLVAICFLLNRPTLAAGIMFAFIGCSILSALIRRDTVPHWAYSVTATVVVAFAFFSRSPGTPTQAVSSSPTGMVESSETGFLGTINSYGKRLESPDFTNEFFNELNTGIGPFKSYLEVGLYLPVAGLKALFYPLPWLANSGFELVFGLYMLWWYGLILLGIVGLLVSSWTWAKFLSIVLVLVLLVGLGIAGPVMSGLIRWRLPITMVMVVWASQSLVWMWSEWRVKCTRGHLIWGL